MRGENIVLTFKQCACGGNDFELEDDTWRCSNCGSLAQMRVAKGKEEKRRKAGQTDERNFRSN